MRDNDIFMSNWFRQNYEQEFVMTQPAAVRKAISRRDFDEVWNDHDLDAIRDIYASDFQGHGFPGGVTLDREQYRRLAGLFIRACPDCTIEPLDLWADDEFVHTQWYFEGTHTEKVGRIPPSNATIRFDGTGRHRHEQGRVVEIWMDVAWSSIGRSLLRGYVDRVFDFELHR
ncbi:hypothetical protein GJR99_13760 [Haloferax sp. MBLA0078]|uniref:SnoaL-like domain-containing protein n=2 Tax=Haloferacaceae TaxID=1644056 RepID=A0A6A8GBM6_9EURY|nr:ester cyclase [Haloferax sp. CBA1150]MRW97633.1 hypothetical protein [Haloferax marinum]